MKLKQLEAYHFRSLRHTRLALEDLNLLIGANASGKSNLLDALRFLSEGLREGDFSGPVHLRGGIVHLAWKGEEARELSLTTEFSDGDVGLVWRVRLLRRNYEFSVAEESVEQTDGRHRNVLKARDGEGYWQSEQGQVRLKLGPTGCALAAAAADAVFPARQLADFIRKWAFFDPDPLLIRRSTVGAADKTSPLDAYGRNLAAKLHAIQQNDAQGFERILDAARSVLALLEKIEPRRSVTEEEEERFYFVQRETGLQYPVHQLGASAGTLRVLALITALYADPEVCLVGLEEPENYVHPGAISSFAEHLKNASGRIQIIVTTHSPLLLSAVGAPEVVCVVRRTERGTEVAREDNPDAVRKALEQSGFGLGEFYETKGFGA